LKKLLLVPVSVIFYLLFGFALVFCHALQWLGLKLGGYRGHKFAVDFMNAMLLGIFYITGNRASYQNDFNFPKNTPLIIVANHQSMFDIIAIGWFMRKVHPKFISKIELGKGIPSVSFNLNHGGSVLIDRKNPRQSLPALAKFGKYIDETKRAAVIFPEGTRSKNGQPKEFNTTGLKILLKNIPDALVVPVTINNSWKILKYGAFPIQNFVHLIVKVHEPIAASAMPADELLEKVEQEVKKAILVED